MLDAMSPILSNEFFVKGQNFDYGTDSTIKEYIIHCYSNKQRTRFILNKNNSLKSLYIPFIFTHSRTLSNCTCVIKNTILVQ